MASWRRSVLQQLDFEWVWINRLIRLLDYIYSVSGHVTYLMYVTFLRHEPDTKGSIRVLRLDGVSYALS